MPSEVSDSALRERMMQRLMEMQEDEWSRGGITVASLLSLPVRAVQRRLSADLVILAKAGVTYKGSDAQGCGHHWRLVRQERSDGELWHFHYNFGEGICLEPIVLWEDGRPLCAEHVAERDRLTSELWGELESELQPAPKLPKEVVPFQDLDLFRGPWSVRRAAAVTLGISLFSGFIYIIIRTFVRLSGA